MHRDDEPTLTERVAATLEHRFPLPKVFGAYGPKPTWRGRLHEIAFFITIPAGLWLLAGATTVAAQVAVAIYWASLAGLFGTSASYHLFAHSPRAVKWMRKLDHSMIFILIAGSYTPFCLVVLPMAWGIPMLVVTWVTALAGVIVKMIKVTTESASAGSWLYIVLGWGSLITLPKLLTHLGFARMALLLVGGVLYTGGAVILGKRRPDPRPATFGYHEIWHAFTIVAAGCHFVLIALVVH